MSCIGSDRLRRPRPLRDHAARPAGRRLRAAQPDPGAGDPAAARGPRHHRPGPDRLGQDRRLRPADDRARRSRRARGAGARPHADARAVHPGHPGAARVRRSARASTSSPSSAARRSAPSRRSCAPAATIVVGTVGRVLDLIQRASLILHDCRFVVLDEADEMLDLGFLEDVERILALTPNSRQTALFSATMPPPIRALADRYLYDPVTVKVKSANADRRHRRAVLGRRQVRRQGRQARRGAARRAPRAGDRLHAHEDPLRPALPQAARPRHERQGAARRHDPGPARRRDARVQGRPRADPRRHRRRRPRPRHLHGHPRHQLRRADEPGRLRPPHRAHGPRRPLGPRHHLHRAAPAARAGAIERHIGTEITPWAEGAHTAAGARRPSARAGTPSRICPATATSRRPSWSPASAAPRASRSPTSSTP